MDRSKTSADRLAPLRRSDIPPAGANPLRRVSGTGAVLGAVLDHGPVARSTIARLTGLSPASVSGHCGALLDRGLVREGPETAGPRGLGRPFIPVEIDTSRFLVAGAHIAVPHVTLSLMDLTGRIVAQERRPHEGSEPGRVLARVAAGLPRLLAAHGSGRTALALGVATGHWVDPEAGTVVHHPQLGWRGVPVRDELAGATGVPVYLDSHSRALARAEQLFGDAGTRRSAVVLFVGNVVDAAFVTAGAVHQGPRFGAGNVAHLPVGTASASASTSTSTSAGACCTCGTAGCLQSEVSEPAMVRRAVERGLPVERFAELLDLAVEGDPVAVELFRQRARLTGRAAAVLLDMFDPEVLVVVEPGTGRLPVCMEELRAEVEARSLVCDDAARSVVPSSFTGSVLATAGAAVALGALHDDPLGPWPALAAVS